MELGVCYYPEHWPESSWNADARRMAAMGLTRVRIGEFAWGRIEPGNGVFDWGWLDRAIATLADAGLQIVMCTPTATPPKWLVDAYPDILAVDATGAPRRFGSRRHYCFSSLTYRRESARITEAVAARYGDHPAITAWQTDNEYGCHDTVLSYSPNAAAAFRGWLRDRYGSIATLNQAWGGVFWSQEYESFDAIDLPFQPVTEGSPSHRQAFRRFASDEIDQFNREQVAILRRNAPGRDILHNFMGASTGFDHFDVAETLDVASWDSYPLGFLEQGPWADTTKARYMRQGHPDFTAFHHDLYRGVGRGRWWVMEQQPGPVNWAPWNPAPLPGMVRAWTWEAFAHGAEVVSYFRWRQVPFAQEQMHAGLLSPDDQEAAAAAEVRDVAAELPAIGSPKTAPAPLALIFSYDAKWLFDIQPQGADFDYSELVLAFYSAARRCGLDVDVVSPAADLAGYRVILAPSLPILDPDLVKRLGDVAASVIFGPRSGSKTRDVHVAEGLPPGPLRALLPLRVSRVESLRRGWSEPGEYPVTRWLEHIESDLVPLATTRTRKGVWYQKARIQYLAAWPSSALLDAAIRTAAREQGLACLDLPDDLRVRRRGGVIFAINYGPDTIDLADHVPDLPKNGLMLGAQRLAPAGVAAWRV